jgi:hypothetical protein
LNSNLFTAAGEKDFFGCRGQQPHGRRVLHWFVAVNGQPGLG